MTPETRTVLANGAASFLLTLLFLALAAVTVAFFMVWRGLRSARREVKPMTARLLSRVTELEQRTTESAARVVEPSIRAASTWTGIKAGLRSIIGGEGTTDRGDRFPL